MALFDDIFQSFGGTPGQGPLGGVSQGLLPGGTGSPPGATPPPRDIPPTVVPDSLSDVGLLPIFDNSGGFNTLEAFQQVLPLLSQNAFSGLDLGQHFAGLVGVGNEADLLAIARLLLPVPQATGFSGIGEFANGLLSSNPSVTVDTGLTDEELTEQGLAFRRLLRGRF